MQVWCPNIVTDNSRFASEVEADLSERLERSLPTCTFEECRRHVDWNKPGMLLLVTGNCEKKEQLESLAKECWLRRSLLKLIVVEPQRTAPDQLTCIEQGIASRLTWPDSASELATLIRAGMASGNRKESLTDELTGRLLQLTPSLAPLAARLALAAMHDVTVLLTGETGTGKTYFARLLHNYSPRRNEPFLIVPCGGQPPEIFSSTFFGHVKGAFTGAHQTQQGKFAIAGKGTILLDEIETLGQEQQAALLRVIETGEYEMVGGSQTLKSEARLIVASNCDLGAAVEQGQFRQDLFYRLDVLKFALPHLRERPSDIPLLARSFAAAFGYKYRKPLADITPEALEALSAFHWPGNIRQLENVLQEAVLVSEGPELTIDDLPIAVRQRAEGNPAGSISPASIAAISANGNANGNGNHLGGSLLRNRAEYERTVILRTLHSCHNNRSSAARILGISRVTLHKKINQYGLRNPTQQ